MKKNGNIPATNTLNRMKNHLPEMNKKAEKTKTLTLLDEKSCSVKVLYSNSSPYGNRTRVSGMKILRPNP